MYDAVIIGGGPGGYVCGIKLAQLGKKVALVEKEALGGTCTNKGCIPTKAMLTVSHLMIEIKEKALKYGLRITGIDYDVSSIMKHVEKSVMLSRKGIEYLMKKNGIDVYKGTGIIENRNTVVLKETGEKLETKNLVLAHGSVPSVFPPFETEGVWTSDDVFKMKEFPKSIVIVGGGVIGIEFATFFSSFDVDVTIVEIADHILPYEDSDVAEEVKKSLKRRGVKILEKTKISSLKKFEDGFEILLETGESLKAERVLLATGRQPNIPEDVKALGIKIDRGVVTDKKMRTNIENVYAIGDIRGDIMLAHVAMYEGIVAAENIAGVENEMDYSAVPNIIFSSPEIASVGLKEKNVKPEDVVISKFPVSANGRARTMLENIGFVKIIAEKKSGVLLGMSIVSPYATDMIMEGVIAVKYRMKAKDLEKAIHPHPTLSETILGALEGVSGRPIHL
ncbi:dihydrolipoyl dehydrogenase [Thermotoga sp. KOL6]|uniref:dihydrolipoyl dehydrogenase n=1 Tax=Thermotoga sp. KOL6 TaxID=126741 RepID=UPI000C77969D|nr:dihydrolipoyl dehydrogenase [Thermotoga sp. KOL6]PLV59120.1 dihydrolipoamide dehydrogenase [Thermotoga sp. KOL6]